MLEGIGIVHSTIKKMYDIEAGITAKKTKKVTEILDVPHYLFGSRLVASRFPMIFESTVVQFFTTYLPVGFSEKWSRDLPVEDMTMFGVFYYLYLRWRKFFNPKVYLLALGGLNMTFQKPLAHFSVQLCIATFFLVFITIIKSLDALIVTLPVLFSIVFMWNGGISNFIIIPIFRVWKRVWTYFQPEVPVGIDLPAYVDDEESETETEVHVEVEDAFDPGECEAQILFHLDDIVTQYENEEEHIPTDAEKRQAVADSNARRMSGMLKKNTLIPLSRKEEAASAAFKRDSVASRSKRVSMVKVMKRGNTLGAAAAIEEAGELPDEDREDISISDSEESVDDVSLSDSESSSSEDSSEDTSSDEDEDYLVNSSVRNNTKNLLNNFSGRHTDPPALPPVLPPPKPFVSEVMYEDQHFESMLKLVDHDEDDHAFHKAVASPWDNPKDPSHRLTVEQQHRMDHHAMESMLGIFDDVLDDDQKDDGVEDAFSPKSRAMLPALAPSSNTFNPPVRVINRGTSGRRGLSNVRELISLKKGEETASSALSSNMKQKREADHKALLARLRKTNLDETEFGNVDDTEEESGFDGKQKVVDMRFSQQSAESALADNRQFNKAIAHDHLMDRLAEKKIDHDMAYNNNNAMIIPYI